MKLVLLLLALSAYAQQQDLVPRAAVQAAIAAIPAQPAPAPDPVVAALKAAGDWNGRNLYDFVVQGLASGQKLSFVGMTCLPPAQWKPNTPYLFGATVTDAAGNAYRLAGMISTATMSGATVTWNTAAIGATTQDAGYTWTLYATAGTGFLCTASAAVPISLAPAAQSSGTGPMK